MGRPTATTWPGLLTLRRAGIPPAAAFGLYEARKLLNPPPGEAVHGKPYRDAINNLAAQSVACDKLKDMWSYLHRTALLDSEYLMCEFIIDCLIKPVAEPAKIMHQQKTSGRQSFDFWKVDRREARASKTHIFINELRALAEELNSRLFDVRRHLTITNYDLTGQRVRISTTSNASHSRQHSRSRPTRKHLLRGYLSDVFDPLPTEITIDTADKLRQQLTMFIKTIDDLTWSVDDPNFDPNNNKVIFGKNNKASLDNRFINYCALCIENWYDKYGVELPEYWPVSKDIAEKRGAPACLKASHYLGLLQTFYPVSIASGQERRASTIHRTLRELRDRKMHNHTQHN